MKKTIITFFTVAILFSMPTFSFAWGAKGHQLVADIAYSYLDSATRVKVQHYLRKMSFAEAGTWMDEVRGDSYYNRMRSWHYIDFPKDSAFKLTAEANALTVLNSAYFQLKHKENLKDGQIKDNILYIFHLVGDLHQPLHCGYNEDRGGNDIQISGPSYGGNLHSFWDSEIIDAKKITLEDLLKQAKTYSQEDINNIQKINLLKWMQESRSYLNRVYDFKDNKVDTAYLDANSIIVRKQLIIAGLRLASILTEVFKTA